MEVQKITVSPDVLLTIARLTTLQVEGVSRMSHVPAGVNRLFRRGFGEGVRIELEDGTIYADIYVNLISGVNIRDVSRSIQHSVGRAFSDIVGMQVGRINIHIEDIDYPATSEV
jgi:uncharacterized alkaline shock family protein YloU